MQNSVYQNLVVIPTYNEKENIERIVRAVLQLPSDFSVLVVDDTSPDGTGQIVSKLMKEYTNRLFLEVREKKEGLAQAYIHGFKWALTKEYHYIFEMDADFSHNPKDLPRLLAELKNGHDMVVGSRYITGVNVVNWPMSRVLLSYLASKYIRLVLNCPFTDGTAGFVGYTKNTLQELDLDNIKLKGYGFQVEMKYKIWKLGKRIKEVSIIFTDRVLGESKISKGIIFEAIFGILMLRIRSLINRL